MRADCPHQDAAVRTCAGCEIVDDGSGMSFCGGEVTGVVSRDSEGDAGVINGINYFWAVDDLTPLCGCTLTEKEQDDVREKLVEYAAQGDYD